jgi:hypothetical protein
MLSTERDYDPGAKTNACRRHLVMRTSGGSGNVSDANQVASYIWAILTCERQNECSLFSVTF